MGGGGGPGFQVIISKKSFELVLDDLEHIPDLKCNLDLERILHNKNAFLIFNVLLKKFRSAFLYKSFQHF